jgi:hypothetical protein
MRWPGNPRKRRRGRQEEQMPVLSYVKRDNSDHAISRCYLGTSPYAKEEAHHPVARP